MKARPLKPVAKKPPLADLIAIISVASSRGYRQVNGNLCEVVSFKIDNHPLQGRYRGWLTGVNQDFAITEDPQTAKEATALAYIAGHFEKLSAGEYQKTIFP